MANGQSITIPGIKDETLTEASIDVKNVEQSIYGMDVNYAAANSWYAYFPIENILGPNYNNINLHLTRFSLPQMEMGSTTVSYKGYQKEIPTKVMNADSKQLTLEYIVDERWRNYRALFQWMNGIYGNLIQVAKTENTTPIQPSDYLPLRIFLLDNYKRKIIQFLFEDCWIKTFSDIALEQNNSEIVTHSFTFCYDNYQIEDII